MKFEIGDRIQIENGGDHTGCHGTVLEEDMGTPWLWVSIDNRIRRGLFHRLVLKKLDVITRLGELA